MIHEDYMKKQAQIDFAFDKSKATLAVLSPKHDHKSVSLRQRAVCYHLHPIRSGVLIG